MKKLQSLTKITRKVTFFMLFCLVTMMYSINVQAQKVTLPTKAKTTQLIIGEIERQTGYKFFYNNNMVNLSRHVLIRAKNENLSSVLDQLFTGTDINYKIIGKTIVLTKDDAPKQQYRANRQKQKVTGQVTDSNGEPIIGASIIEQGSSNGTISDLEGNFDLRLSAGTNIKISYIGYETQTIQFKGQDFLKVRLQEDTKSLNEVVVVGYGTQKKSDMTGSVTSIPKERLSKLPVSNVLQAIQGAAAGVTITQSSAIPGDSPTALVRGRNSINADSGPYIVVDGVPISKAGGTLNDINPNDIESIEILKDASAVAIYGTNGANGVILVTTKRGSSGKPTVRYGAYIGIESIAHKLDPASPEQLLQRYKDYVAQNPGESMFNNDVRYANEADNYAAGKTTDWIDEATQTGIISDNNISVSGGAENVKYFISGDFLIKRVW